MKEKGMFQDIQNWMHRNARSIDLSLWKVFFENGTKEAVVEELMYYQNEDGGFGKALEADNWNPDSSPIATNHAIKILKSIGFYEMDHPVYQGIWKYLNSKKDCSSYGWRFTLPSNEDHPHAPWWNYSEAENEKEYYGVTAEFSAFILEYGEEDMACYSEAVAFGKKLMQEFLEEKRFGDMGLEGFILLIETMELTGFTEYDYTAVYDLLSKKITAAIEHDTTKWSSYGARPSNFIHSPDSRFYKENEAIVQEELTYLMNTKPEGDVWGITWTWFQNMEQYGKYFTISENWWKGFRAVENVRMLKSFERI